MSGQGEGGVSSSLIAAATAGLPLYAAVLERLAHEVAANDELRWLEVGCSFGSGRADVWSDIDAAIGYEDAGDIDRLTHDVVERVGPVVDLLVHCPVGAPDLIRRFAVEYRSGVQLDLVVMPASWRTGLFDGSLSIVDKDGVFSRPATSELAGPPSPAMAREWAMLGWWAVSDIAKYLRRGSLFEATARIDTVRDLALRLHATARSVPFPSFGLTSLLDVDPPELPPHLAETYCRPDDRSSVASAATAVARLLQASSDSAARAIDADLTTRWSTTAQQRLQQAAPTR